jgi:lysophospholipase L1-like esterase
MEVDFVAKKIRFYDKTILIFKKARYIIANGATREVDISSITNASMLYGLYYNPMTDAFRCIDTGTIATVTDNDILIATFNIGSRAVSTPNALINHNGSYGILVSSASYPNFDFANNKITLYPNTILIHKKSRYVVATGSNTEINISGFASTDQVAVFCNISTGIFSCYSTSQISNLATNLITDNDVLIATFNKAFKLVYMAGGYKVNGVAYGINPPTTNSRFAGAVGNFLGDSITWGYSPADGTQLANLYPSLVGQKLALATVNNYGVSGSTIADYTGDGTTRDPMCIRYANMADTAEFVFVFGGTNDWTNNVAIGAITDTVKTSFYGALNALIDGLITKYPTQSIIIATPMHRQGDTVANTAGSTLKDYRDAIIAVGLKYGIAILDLYATSGFYPDNTTNYNSICPDGRHLLG